MPKAWQNVMSTLITVPCFYKQSIRPILFLPIYPPKAVYPVDGESEEISWLFALRQSHSDFHKMTRLKYEAFECIACHGNKIQWPGTIMTITYAFMDLGLLGALLP